MSAPAIKVSRDQLDNGSRRSIASLAMTLRYVKAKPSGK